MSYILEDLFAIRDAVYTTQLKLGLDMPAYQDEMTADKLNQLRKIYQDTFDNLSSEIEKIDRRIEELSFPKQPGDIYSPTVITFRRKNWMGKMFDYAAISHERYGSQVWSLTGQTTDPMSWKALLDFIGKPYWHTISRVTETKAI